MKRVLTKRMETLSDWAHQAKPSYLLGAILAAALWISSVSIAQEMHWIGGTNGNFDTATNWDPQTGDLKIVSGGTGQITLTTGFLSADANYDVLFKDADILIAEGTYGRLYAFGGGTATIDHTTLSTKGAEICAASGEGNRPGDGTIIIQNGSNVTVGGYNLAAGWGPYYTSVTGYLKVLGGEHGGSTVSVPSSGVIIGDKATGELLIDGGSSVSSSGGAGVVAGQSATGVGTITVNNGTLEAKSGKSITIGLKGTGTLNVNPGASIISANQFGVGWEADSEGDVWVSGGTITATQGAYIGASGTGTVTMTGGKLESTEAGIILANANGGSGALKMSGQAQAVSKTAFIVGNNGTGTLEMSGNASITASEVFKVGAEATGSGSVTMRGKSNASVSGDIYFNHGSNVALYDNAKMISAANLFINDGSHATLYNNAELKCSVIYGIGNNSSLSVLDINGGLASCPSWFCTGYTGKGTVNVYEGGTVYANNIGSGTRSAGDGKLNVLGGTVKTDWLLIGEDGKGEVTLTSGILTNRSNAPTRVTMSYAAASSATLNLLGGQGDWTFSTMEFNQGASAINFQALPNDGDLSHVTVNSNVTIKGTVAAEAPYGLAMMNKSSYEILSLSDSSFTLNTDSATLSSSDTNLFNVSQTGNTLVASLNTLFKKGTLQINASQIEFASAPTGYMELINNQSSDPILMTLKLSDSILTPEILADLNESLAPSGLTATMNASDSLTFENFMIAANGYVFAWDLPALGINDVGLIGMSSNSVPEPSTWALLILGAVGLVVLRKRRA